MKRRVLGALRGPVAKILSGSAVGQAAMLAVAPILTRLYEPSDFAAFAVVTALASVLGAVVTLSMERAVVLPRDDKDAKVVVLLGVGSVAIASVLLLFFFFVSRDLLVSIFSSDVFRDYWWLIPVTTVLVGLQTVLSAIFVRAQRYGVIAGRNALQGLSQAVSSVALGLAGVVPFGLVSSLAVGRLFGVLSMLRRSWPSLAGRHSRTDFVRVARRYSEFARITVWARLLNSLGLQLPVVLVVAIFASFEAGLFALAIRVLAMPVSVVADAVSQTFEGTFASSLRERRPGLAAQIMGTSGRLLAIGAPAGLVLTIWGPWLFRWIFGDEWAIAGQFAQILAVSYVAQFVVAPISRSLVLLERQQAQFWWDLCRSVASISAVLVIGLLGYEFMWYVVASSAIGVIAYAVLFGLALRSARRYESQVRM